MLCPQRSRRPSFNINGRPKTHHEEFKLIFIPGYHLVQRFIIGHLVFLLVKQRRMHPNIRRVPHLMRWAHALNTHRSSDGTHKNKALYPAWHWNVFNPIHTQLTAELQPLKKLHGGQRQRPKHRNTPIYFNL